MKKVLALLTAAMLAPALFAQMHRGLFEHAADVGAVKRPGTTLYYGSSQSYELNGSGANIWGSEDQFHFAYRAMEGDVLLQTRGRLLDASGDPHRKFGWMLRSGLSPDAAMICAAVHADGLAALQFRRTAGGPVEEIRAPLPHPDVLHLERRGDTFLMSVARFGEPLQTLSVSLPLPASLLGGLYVCAHDSLGYARAAFDYVRIVLPPAAGFVPYRDYLGSHLETLDVLTGKRSILRSFPGSIQAPNWTPDNQALIYNSEGRIYRYDLHSESISLVETGSVQQNNNDHVISFDGKMLGLSSASGEAAYGSLIYTLPIGGGEPRRITPLGPSYLHGWSPDGQWLTYTGERQGAFDIYKISAEGGEEIRLTDSPGLDDGSEYSPNGQYIYFNSMRSGSMELWRMRPDGSQPEQLTSDEFQNWFPHLSPDGRWILFLSYLPDVPPGDHPFYRQVYLRMMPAEGGKPWVVAYLFGGQGTINTPSWSPDGRRAAFVSNSGM